MTADPCPARFQDCRCSATTHDPGHAPAAIHSCGLPGCGALWVSPDHVVRLPGKALLRRRYGRANLRVA